MSENKILSFDNENITPEEYITLMFERTDEDGVLYIPWKKTNGYDFDIVSCRCRMSWNLYDYEKSIKEFKELYDDLKSIALLYEKLGDDINVNKKILGSERLFKTWFKFVRKFDIPGFDYDVIDEISDRYITINDIKKISKKISAQVPLDEFEKNFLKDNLDVTVSNEEERMYKKYWELRYKQAEKRVGENICAHYLIMTAMRLCRLLSLNAPKLIIDNESRELASSMVVHKFAQSKEDVDDNIRYNIEKLENMSDEELDEYYRPKKTNTRKSMAPLYV
ncbi:MAG: hypothetical protein E7562_03525 [Ruminococcaceae bacterium]|nr:hypothetical protein [Oscillospiraceae bacterium]